MEIRKLLHHLTKTEKIICVLLTLIFAVSAYQLAGAFYQENTEPDYIAGGVYIEGAVGQVGNINPLFVQQGSVTDDLVKFIFSGLTKYDVQTGEIVGDLANFKIDPGKKQYTFVLRENASWHDGKKVSAEDILFTYNDLIKNPKFKGNIQNYNEYSGIKINKVDDRTVEFLLEKPDSFFLVKTMIGILPKHILEKEDVTLLESSPFNFAPIGTGPYKFSSEVQFPDHVEYSLEAYKAFYDDSPNIDNLLIKVYESYEALKKDVNDFDGIRSIPGNETADLLNRDFNLDRFELAQYVAIFINHEAPKLKDSNVRLGLQLGTDKQTLLDKIGQNKIIDTPLLEIDQKNWVNQYSVLKANGALYLTGWQIPNKAKFTEKKVVESELTYINSPNGGKDWETTQDPLTITGTAPKDTKSIMINDYELKKFTPGDSGWTYLASTKLDSLKTGENIYEVFATNMKGEKKLIDSITIEFNDPFKATDTESEKLKKENKEAGALPTRQNSSGEKFSLRLITSSKPDIYPQIAEEIKRQWQKIGVELQVEVLDADTFASRLSKRDYDLLIFGQSLGYNLDAYPYWHSSQAKEGGLNLSQFKNFVVDSLLEKARLEEAEERKKTLRDIQAIIAREIPAIFLYSPTYFSAISQNAYHPPFNFLATTSDRLAEIEDWYSNVHRKFKPGHSVLMFFPWVLKQF